MASVAERLRAMERWPLTGGVYVQCRVDELTAIRAEVEAVARGLREAGWETSAEFAARLAPEEKP